MLNVVAFVREDMDFRKVYSPVQPGAGPLNMNVKYSESLPHPALSKYVYCYWRLNSTKKFSLPFAYRVIPDGCIDIFFNANNFTDARIMGFSTSYTMFELEGCFDYVGVRFMPASFPAMFGVDASTLAERDEDLFAVVPSFARDISKQLQEASDYEHIKSVLDNTFLKRVGAVSISEDKRLYNAIDIVLRNHGNVNIKSEIDTGISPRQLRRLFQFYIGDTPKVFSKIVRFQHFFQLLSSQNGHAYNKLFLDAGYYDQPHFTREFKMYFGLTPGEALSS